MTSSLPAERYILRALWPVVSETAIDELRELMLIASAELPLIASRQYVDLSGKPRWSVQPGWQVPGSGGSLFIVTCDVSAHPHSRE